MEVSDFRKIEIQVLNILEEFNIDQPVIPIFDIAQKKGFTIQFVDMPADMKNYSGGMDVKKKIIFLNIEDSPNRQIFTVAHEFAHYTLGHRENDYGVLEVTASMNNDSPLELEANILAAHILVPNIILKDIMKKYHLTKADISLLAKIFGVPRDVMIYRLQHL